ncbi:MAG: hypothetical protein KGS72_04725 [Cyanobacteria bacterium REEB67]|nr:hypothetical protein [Cyanobacteria bacterium REEB67]
MNKMRRLACRLGLGLGLSLSALSPLCPGPAQMVLADSDISSQFPDQLPGQNFSPAAQRPWVVDQYRGSRRRQKRFNSPEDNQYGATGALPSPANYAAFNNNPNNFGNGGFNNASFGNGGNGAGLRGNQAPRPDKFVDFPDTDTSGVRHFANGRHYDLKNISIEQAVATSAAGDQQIQEEMQQARRQRRNRNRNRMRNGF